MKLVKMSLAAAVAVAGLSTASFAKVEITDDYSISGKYRFRYDDLSYEDETKSKDRQRHYGVFTNTFTSPDGKGKAVLSFASAYKTFDNNVGLVKNNTYLDESYGHYDFGMADVTVGRFYLPTGFTDEYGDGVILGANAAGQDIKVIFIENSAYYRDGNDRTIIALKGEASVIDYKANVELGQNLESPKIMAVVNANVADATVSAAYAMADTDVSMLGVGGAYAMGDIKVAAGYTMAGAKGGTVADLYMGGQVLGAPLAGGDEHIAQKADASSIYATASAKVAGIGLGAGGIFAGDDSIINVNAGTAVNEQTSLNVYYNINANGDVKYNKLRVQLQSSF